MFDISQEPADLTPIEAADKLAQLARLIAYHNDRYHGQDDPEISDAEFDALVRYNRALEEAFPELVRKDTPEAQVGAKPQSGFGKIVHEIGMLSLSNAFADEDVHEFIARIRRFLSLDDTAPVSLMVSQRLMVCHWHCAMRAAHWCKPPQEVMGQLARM